MIENTLGDTQPTVCPVPTCHTLIDVIEVPLAPKPDAPRPGWLVPCGHSVVPAFTEAAYERGTPPVLFEGITGVALTATERRRQRTEEGHSDEADARHSGSELAWAAWCYIDAGLSGQWDAEPPQAWPWKPEDWKPGPTAIRCFVKAAALICAEIDRRLRQGEHP